MQYSEEFIANLIYMLKSKEFILILTRFALVAYFILDAVPKFVTAIGLSPTGNVTATVIDLPTIALLELVLASLLLIGLWSKWVCLLLAFVLFLSVVTHEVEQGITANLFGYLINFFALLVVATNGPGYLSKDKEHFF